MQVIINGEERELPGPLTVAELLRRLGVKPEHVAVEINKDLVTRSRLGRDRASLAATSWRSSPWWAAGRARPPASGSSP